MNGISLVIPTYNEEESLPLLCEQINDALDGHPISHEIIFVEDGSTDKSFKVLKQSQGGYPAIKIVKLKKRCGQGISLAIGIQQCQYDRVITLDSDLQDDPQDIPRFLELLEKDWDFVCGWRKNRQETFFPKILISRMGNFVLSKLTHIAIHDFSCTFRCYKASVAKNISQYLGPGLHRFIPYFGKKLKYRFCEIETTHRLRKYGKSKYTICKIFQALYDFCLISFFFKKTRKFSQKKLLSYIDSII
jgi:glycosyltransferase involved in cell wall biosynthesis